MIHTVAQKLTRRLDRPRVQRLIERGAPTLMVIVSVAGVLRATKHEIDPSFLAVQSFQGEYLLASLLVTLISSLAGAVFWRTLVVSAGFDIPVDTAVRVWILSAPSKYGLGALGQYGTRLYLAERNGVPRQALLVSLALEVGLIFVSAAVVVLALAPLCLGLLWAEFSSDLYKNGPAVAIVLGLASPVLGRKMLTLVPSRWLRPPHLLRLGSLYLSMVLIILNWSLMGTSLFLLTRSMGSMSLSLLPATTFIVTIAVVAGLVGISPAGLGIREVTMALLLSRIVPLPIATASAVLHRLVTLAAEFLWAGGLVSLPALKSGTSLPWTPKRWRAQRNSPPDGRAGTDEADPPAGKTGGSA